MATVGDLLDEMDRERGAEQPAPPKAAEPFKPARLKDAPKLPAPGLYFGMPDEAYHALPALSASGVKLLSASPMLYWANQAWLSEEAAKRAEEDRGGADEKAFRTIGKAYHCRILEGSEEYARRFATELPASECQGALESTDQIKAAIAAKGGKPVAKVEDMLPDGGGAYQRAAKKEDWIAQLLELDPEARVLSRLREAHAKAHAGKAFIPFDAHQQIEIAAKMIEGDAQARNAVRGGYPEVTLIWNDAETGVPMKARADRLKLKAIVDLKSLAPRELPIRHAIRFAIAQHKYNIQPSVYAEGAAAVRELIRKGGGGNLGPVISCDGLAGAGEHGARLEWAAKWAAETEEPEWWWLFQQKGIAPVARLVQYPMQGVTRRITDEILRTAKRRFREYSERYGTDPWLDLEPAYTIDDEAIPPSATENLRSE